MTVPSSIGVDAMSIGPMPEPMIVESVGQEQVARRHRSEAGW